MVFISCPRNTSVIQLDGRIPWDCAINSNRKEITVTRTLESPWRYLWDCEQYKVLYQYNTKNIIVSSHTYTACMDTHIQAHSLVLNRGWGGGIFMLKFELFPALQNVAAYCVCGVHILCYHNPLIAKPGNCTCCKCCSLNKVNPSLSTLTIQKKIRIFPVSGTASE